MPRERLGKVGCCFLLREDEEMLDDSYFIVTSGVDFEGSATGAVGRVCSLGNEATGGDGGRDCLGGVEAR